ncbi:MAG TPA: universal stress protein [Bryobacteraceae bacterium]|nr:universal stress protein [Bryobacteraceae bacterium]
MAEQVHNPVQNRGIENDMFKFDSILFPVDFSERSRAAAPFVLSIAQRYKSRVVLLHAFEPPPPLYGGMNTVYPMNYDFTSVETEMKQKLVEFASDQLPKVNVTTVCETGFAVSAITDYAQKNNIDLIAMPTHGYGPFRRALLGSVTAKVLHDTSVPVWTDAHAPEPSHRAHPQPRHILAALDLKQESKHVLEAALQLAADAGATVEVVHAAPEGEITPIHSEARLREVTVEAAREAMVAVKPDQAGTEVDVVVDTGNVSKLLRSVAIRKRSDLIVIGRGALHEPFSIFRSNAFEIVRDAPCPVLSL